MKRNLNIYACGGTAANIMERLIKSDSSVEADGLANFDITYVDTSRSNLPEGEEDKFYHIHDPSVVADGRSETDGSGKDRAFVYELAVKQGPLALRQFVPGDFNVVIHSGYGGSGNMIGYILTKEMLEAGKNVFVIIIGGEGDEAGITNTQRVIYSYQQLSENLNRTIGISYIHIDINNPTSVVYAQAIRNLGYIAAMCSGENHGLDTHDIHNFLNAETKSKFEPGLMGVSFIDGDEHLQLEEGEAISGMISLVENSDQADSDIITPYHVFGEAPRSVFDHLGSSSPIRMVGIQNYFTAIDTILKSKLLAHKEAFKAVHSERLKVEGDDIKVTSSGVVL